MTADTVTKEAAAEFTAGGRTCRIGGIAKGSGMIHPNMATMLVFVTTDAAITREMLQKALSEDVKNSFNMVSVDGTPPQTTWFRSYQTDLRKTRSLTATALTLRSSERRLQL